MNGAGTSGDPWQVANYTDLKKVGRGLDADTNTYDLGDYYVQTADIDASPSTEEDWTNEYGEVTADYQGWIPISGTFTGMYDGDGFVIYDLYMKRNASGSALFSRVDGTVRDLGLRNWTMQKFQEGSNTQYMGGIVADLYGTISRCWMTGSLNVEAGYYLGAIAGRVRSGGLVEDCYSGASVSNSAADARISTIVGRLESGATVRRCHGYGEIIRLHATPTAGGGIVGTSSGTITDCFWDGTINDGTEVTGGGTETTTANMKAIATYTTGGVNWDMVLMSAHDGELATADWFIDAGTDYPRLWFESASSPSAAMPQYIYGA